MSSAFLTSDDGTSHKPPFLLGLLPRHRGSLGLLASNLSLSLGNAQALPSGGETLSTEAVRFRLGLSLPISLPCCPWLNLSKTVGCQETRSRGSGSGVR